VWLPGAFGHAKAAEELLEKKADANAAEDKNQRTPLHFAAIQGYEDVVKVLHRYKADLNLVDKEGHSALLLACLNGQATMAQLLVRLGAGKEARTNSRRTALMLAAQNGSVSTVRVLLQHVGPDEQPCDAGKTALLYACESGHRSVAKVLIDAHANVNQKAALTQESALILACSYGQAEVVKMLRREGARLEDPSVDGRTPLHAASQSSMPSLLAHLVRGITEDKMKAMLGARDRFGKTPLEVAIDADASVEFCQIFIENGAALDDKDSDGNSVRSLVERKGPEYQPLLDACTR